MYCGLHALMAEVHLAITGVLDGVTLADTIKTTLRKIRRNKAMIPFVKMVTRRSPRKAAGKTRKTTAIKRRKPVPTPLRKKRSASSRTQTH